MDTSQHRAGSARAPDITAEELADDPHSTIAPASAEEILAHGPQPEHPVGGLDDAQLERLKRLQAEVQTPREAPDMRAKIQEAREHREPPDAEVPMDPSEAEAALDIMLSAVEPPTQETDWFTVPRLTRRYGRTFWIRVRELGDTEMDDIEEASLREATRKEKDRGATGMVRDIAKLNLMICTQAMLVPDVRNPKLMTKFGPRPRDVVQKWLTQGERAQLAAKVNELSGWADGAILRAKG